MRQPLLRPPAPRPPALPQWRGVGGLGALQLVRRVLGKGGRGNGYLIVGLFGRGLPEDAVGMCLTTSLLPGSTYRNIPYPLAVDAAVRRAGWRWRAEPGVVEQPRRGAAAWASGEVSPCILACLLTRVHVAPSDGWAPELLECLVPYAHVVRGPVVSTAAEVA